jgi:hypothetical protein
VNRVYLVIDGGEQFSSEDARAALRRELHAHTGDALHWDDEVTWDPETNRAFVSCTGVGDELSRLKELAVTEVASAIGRLSPGSDATVRALKSSLVLAPRPTTYSEPERWGWYEVGLRLQAEFIRDSPDTAEYIAEELKLWQRFRDASFVWNQARGDATLHVRVLARSADAADGEARDALENLIDAAVRDPDAFAIESVDSKWISPPEAGAPPRVDHLS